MLRLFQLLLLIVCAPADEAFAEASKPVAKTKKVLVVKDDYYQQVTKGHPRRWFDQDMAIRVYIAPGDGVPDYKPEFREILRSAFKKWEEISESRIKFEFVEKQPDIDITCDFTNNVLNNDTHCLGLARYTTTPHRIAFVDVSISTRKKEYLSKEQLFDTCLHEVGHSLGLMSHSLDPHDVMYAYASTGKARGLSSRDVNTLRKLYQYKPPLPVPLVAQAPPSTSPDSSGANAPKIRFGVPTNPIILSSDEYDEYTRPLASMLEKRFAAYPARPMLECDVRCFVDSSGNIFNYDIFAKSHNDDFDQKVLDTIVAAVPFPPAPEELTKNKWNKAPVAFRFRSDGVVIPYVEPDPVHSDWIVISEKPSTPDLLNDLEKDKVDVSESDNPKKSNGTQDAAVVEWTNLVIQKAQKDWKSEGSGWTEVLMGVKKDGRISHLVISTPSGDDAYDQAALDACLSAEAFPKAPDSADEITEVRILFRR